MIKRLGLAVILLFVVLFILPLGVRPVAIVDEARYGEIPREMIESGNWVVPHLNGLRYFEKPAMGYWLNALSMLVFGENAFAIRFTSAASVGLCALLIFWLVRRETGNDLQALISSIVYMTSLLVIIVGLTSVLDSMLTLFTTCAVVFFLAAYREEIVTYRRIFFYSIFGLFCALAFMTKGFIAFAVPVVIIVPFMLWERRFKDLILFPAWPIIIAVMTILPWAIMIHLREADYWHYFFWEEHIQRYMTDEAQHEEPFWFFAPVLLAGILPWTFVLPAAIKGLKKTFKEQPLMRYALCWFVMPFLFFSASRGKLGTYILPCFPAFGILTAYGLLTYFKQEKTKAFNIGAGILAGILGIGAAVLAAIQLIPAIPIKVFTPPEGLRWLVLTLALAGWGVAAVYAIRAQKPLKKILLYSIGPAVFTLCVPFGLPDELYVTRSADPFLNQYADNVPAESIMVSDANRVHAACWFFKRNDIYLLGDKGEMRYGLRYPDSQHRILQVPDLVQMVEEHRGKRPVTIMTCWDRYVEYKDQLPEPVFEHIQDDVHCDRRLVLVQY
ncbi:MAG: phospholipid carrier-dependent glycosyltransferase [Spartobacteria bacterium]|nr:phospholipid carrier-dependent glycosyltransferase [Spartobacteria bacterium]